MKSPTRDAIMPFVRVKTKGQVTIPMELRRELKLEEGDVLEAQVKRGSIVLKPQAIVPRDEVEKAIAEGLDDVKKGRVYGPYKSVSELKKALKSS